MTEDGTDQGTSPKAPNKERPRNRFGATGRMIQAMIMALLMNPVTCYAACGGPEIVSCLKGTRLHSLGTRLIQWGTTEQLDIPNNNTGRIPEGRCEDALPPTWARTPTTSAYASAQAIRKAREIHRDARTNSSEPIIPGEILVWEQEWVTILPLGTHYYELYDTTDDYEYISLDQIQQWLDRTQGQISFGRGEFPEYNKYGSSTDAVPTSDIFNMPAIAVYEAVNIVADDAASAASFSEERVDVFAVVKS